MRAQRASSRNAAAVATKVIVRTTTREGGTSGAAFRANPARRWLAAALALSLGSQMSRDIGFGLRSTFIPGKLPPRPRATRSEIP
jgi:hypothetical protein